MGDEPTGYSPENDEHDITPERELSGTYAQLAAPFDTTFTDQRGGVTLTYISGEQAVSRLNLTLGPGQWSFTIPREGYEAGEDWLWALGHLEATIDGHVCVREQYGGSQVKRSAPLCGAVFEEGARAGEVCNDKRYEHEKRHKDHVYQPQPRGVALNIGYDKKAAATDAFKKCAQGLGVGLYLSARVQTADGKGVSAAQGRQAGQQRQPQQARSAASGAPASRSQRAPSTSSANGAAPRAGTPPTTAPEPQAAAPAHTGDYLCEVSTEGHVCGAPLREKEFADKSKWTVEHLVQLCRSNTAVTAGKLHCFPHYKAAVDATKTPPANKAS